MNPGSDVEMLLNKTNAVVRGEFTVREAACNSMKFVVEVYTTVCIGSFLRALNGKKSSRS
jgi:hypothetical protein